jgi:hypothetical protein
LRYLCKNRRAPYQLDLKTPGKAPTDASFLKEIRDNLKSLELEEQRPFSKEVDLYLLEDKFFNE